jgi:hypothetical protein
MYADLIHFFTVNWLGQAIVILAQCLAVTVPLLVAVAPTSSARSVCFSLSRTG